MKTSHLICWLVTVTVVGLLILSHAKPLSERDAYLWELYQNSPTQEIHNAVTKIAYLDSRIDMLGLILFGARNHRSVLRSVRGENLPLVDDQQCLKSTMKSFEKHCGVVTEHRMKQSLANICNYVADKAAIEEAIIVACAMHTIESHGIDMGNPKIDFTPAPIHGTSLYCGRVSVNVTPRMKLYSYITTYKVMLAPSQMIPERYDNMIQVCFHRNDSLGLCQCEKDEWRPVQKRSWSSSMRPYEQRFIDVKFVVQLSGSVTITLDEVSHGWCYVLLVGGITLLFMAVSKAPMLSKKTKMWPRNGLGQGTVDALRDGGSTGSQKYCHSTDHNIRNRMKFSQKEYEELPGQSVAELASSPEFEEWMIKNAHRIKFRPEDKKR